MIPSPLPEKCMFSQGNHGPTPAPAHNSLLIYGWVQLKTCPAWQSHFSSHGTQGHLIPETLPSHQEGALRDGKGTGFIELRSRKEEMHQELKNPWELSLLNAVELGVFAAFCKCLYFLLKKNGRIKTILLTHLHFADLFKAKKSK